MSKPTNAKALRVLTGQIEQCRLCPRLVEWREQVAREKRAAFRDQDYWGKPVPGFGDPRARLLVVGLAPAAGKTKDQPGNGEPRTENRE